MGEWKEYKLGEIIKIVGGGTPKTSECRYWNGNIPWLSVVDFNNDRKYVYETEKHISIEGLNNSSTKILSKGDIIISARGTVGAMAMLGKDMAFNQSCYGIQPTKLVDRDYLYYLLFSSIQELKHNSHGGVFDTITRDTFDTIEILLPSLKEQKRIASILSSLDDKIDLLHQENKTLEAMAETLFRKWFIEDAENSVKQGYLGDYILDTIGGEWGKEVSQDDFVKPVKCIRGTDIAALNTGIPSKTLLRFIKKSKYEMIKPLDGDIIIEISGGTENQSTGRSSYINKDVCGLFDYPIIFSNFCRLLRVEKKYSYFVYCYLQYLYSQDEFFNIENGSSGIKNLDYKTLLYSNQYQMPNNKNFAANFSEIVTPYFTKIDKNKLQICNLMKMRETLLPRLMLNCKK